MELGLSLGEAPKPFGFLEKPRDQVINNKNNNRGSGFCMALSIGPCSSTGRENDQNEADEPEKEKQQQRDDTEVENDPSVSTDSPPVQLDLLPRTPVPRSHIFPWISSENGETYNTHMPKSLPKIFLFLFPSIPLYLGF